MVVGELVVLVLGSFEASTDGVLEGILDGSSLVTSPGVLGEDDGTTLGDSPLNGQKLTLVTLPSPLRFT